MCPQWRPVEDNLRDPLHPDISGYSCLCLPIAQTYLKHLLNAGELIILRVDRTVFSSPGMSLAPRCLLARGPRILQVTSFLVSSRYAHLRLFCEEDEQIKK